MAFQTGHRLGPLRTKHNAIQLPWATMLIWTTVDFVPKHPLNCQWVNEYSQNLHRAPITLIVFDILK